MSSPSDGSMSTSTPAGAISNVTYEQFFLGLLGTSVSLIVLSALWVVALLVRIEASKASFISVHVDGAANSLEMTETGPDGLEVEKETPTGKRQVGRRVRTSFKLLQLLSVSSLLLLTYLLLVVSNAPLWASAIGSLCVFGVFLRYQIGDELRRQRIDRIALILSLFLWMAGLMSLCTYSFKVLSTGEVYEGPARVVAYDASGYNNSSPHDPSTRTDLQVEWGKAWGCPLTNGKVCRANVAGAMCTVGSQRKRRSLVNSGPAPGGPPPPKAKAAPSQPPAPPQDQTEGETVASGMEQLEGEAVDEQQDELIAQEGTEQGTQDEEQMLEDELVDEEMTNEELVEENEELKAELEKMQLEEDETEVLAEEEIEEVEEEESEDEAIYDEEVEELESEVLDIEEEYSDEVTEAKKEVIETKEEYETDPDAIEEDETQIEELDEDQEEVDELIDEYIDEFDDAADQYAEKAEDAREKESEIEDEEMQTIDEYDEAISEVEGGADWYWDEVTYEYDDDWYEAEYWDYDWDLAWGEYSCEDLFTGDISQNYDTSVPAGQDGYPTIKIYGSCKHCEAYVLDYFAEEAFESVQEYAIQAGLYLSAAFCGFVFSFISYMKFRVRPNADNEIELLGGDGGVMA